MRCCENDNDDSVDDSMSFLLLLLLLALVLVFSVFGFFFVVEKSAENHDVEGDLGGVSGRSVGGEFIFLFFFLPNLI